MVHRSRLSPLSPPPYILLRSIDRSGPILFLLSRDRGDHREGKTRKEERRLRRPRSFGYSLHLVAAGDIRSLRNDQKLSRVLRKHTLVYMYPLSSLSSSSSSSSHVWSHRRRSSLLSRIHTLLFLLLHRLLLSSIPSSSFSLSLTVLFLRLLSRFLSSSSAPMLSRILPMFLPRVSS